jgi:hypothetical protein
MPLTAEQKLRILGGRSGTYKVFVQGKHGNPFMQHVDTAYSRRLIGKDDASVIDHDAWRAGICYGLSMLYLFSCRSGQGASVLTEVASQFEAFKTAGKQSGEAIGSGMLEYLAHLHIMQESGDNAPAMLVRKGVKVPDKVKKMLGRSTRPNENGTDALMRERGLEPFPRGGHAKEFYFQLEDKSTINAAQYSSQCGKQTVEDFVSFIGPAGAYSYIGFTLQQGGGHAMAAVGASRGCSFFDPNWGVATFSFNSLMVSFLRKIFPFLYFWKGRQGSPDKDPRQLGNLIQHGRLKITALNLSVRRYRTVRR